MTFKNPLGQCGLFATMSHEELEKHIEQFNGQERFIAATIYGMTLNMCEAYVDGAIKEQAAWEDELLLSDARQMHMDVEAHY